MKKFIPVLVMVLAIEAVLVFGNSQVLGQAKSGGGYDFSVASNIGARLAIHKAILQNKIVSQDYHPERLVVAIKQPIAACGISVSNDVIAKCRAAVLEKLNKFRWPVSRQSKIKCLTSGKLCDDNLLAALTTGGAGVCASTFVLLQGAGVYPEILSAIVGSSNWQSLGLYVPDPDTSGHPPFGQPFTDVANDEAHQQIHFAAETRDIHLPNNPVRVAVIDTGLGNDGVVYADAKNFAVPFGTSSWPTATFNTNQVNDDYELNSDWVGHGTGVASIIANPEFGIDTTAEVLPIKVFSKNRVSGQYSGSGFSMLVGICYADAMTRATANPVRVVNISASSLIGAPFIHAAINELKKHALVVVAAGNIHNEATDMQAYPADWSHGPNKPDGLVAVGGHLYKDSNQSERVDLMAPGIGISALDPRNTVRKNFYSGTSFAAPFVAGAAALKLSDVPGLAPVQLEKMLIETADRNYGHNDDPASCPGKSCGAGMLDVLDLMQHP